MSNPGAGESIWHIFSYLIISTTLQSIVIPKLGCTYLSSHRKEVALTVLEVSILTFLGWLCGVCVYRQRNRESSVPKSVCLREFCIIQETQPRTLGSLPQGIDMRLNLQKKPEKFTFHKQDT